MTPYPITLLGVLAAAALSDAPANLTGSWDAGQQTTPAKPAEPSDLPVSLERIQKKLERDPAIKVDKLPLESARGLPTFRILVDAPKLTTEQILGPDFLRGPVPATGMTHQEFLDLVTPTDVRGYAAFTNEEGITVALTSLALQWALKSALQELREAKDERAREEARKEVKEALDALRKARRDAGLPDR
jgi:hypothetical protein